MHAGGEREPRERTRARARGLGRTRGGLESTLRRLFARPGLARAERVWRKTLRLLRPLGAVSWGNLVRVLADGDEAFEAMWGALEKARHSALFNTYILEPDRVGRRTLDELARAAERGCRVLVVLDAFGSHRIGEDELASLRAAGARVRFYNPIVRWPLGRRRARLSRLVRNHRKILVVDGRIAFCGGMNVAEEYAGPRHGTNVFRDTQVRLEGPAARDLERLVEHLAGEIDGERERPGPAADGLDAARAGRIRIPELFEELASDPDEPAEGSLVQILESSVRRDRRTIQKALRTTLARAIERCYLTSPYFVPPQRLMRSLSHAARRGVDVRVLTAGRSDVPLVRHASQHLYGKLLRRGVRIFEMRPRVLHAKTAVIDGIYAQVGSSNLDYWSDRRNLEVSVSILDRTAAGELEQQFLRDLQGSQEVLLETWEKRSPLRRLLCWLSYQVLRL